MCASLLGDIHSAEHARDFIDPFLSFERFHRRARDFAVAQFGDAKLRMRLRCDLGKMRYAQHLRPPAQVSQLLADDLGDRAADACVHFVEYHAHGRCSRAPRDLNGEADARQFAARGDFRQAFQRLAGIGAYQVLHLVTAVRGEFLLAGTDLHGKLAAGHAQGLHQLAHLTAEQRSGGAPRIAQALRGAAVLLYGHRDLLLERRQTHLNIVESGHFLFGLRELLRQLQHRHAVFSCQGFERCGAALDLILARGVNVQFIQVMPQSLRGFLREDGGLAY